MQIGKEEVYPVKKIAFISMLIAIVIPCAAAQSGEKTYAVGDRGPAGGVIFYDKGNSKGGWRYLEAAPEDQSAGTQWWNEPYNFVGRTRIGTGTGRENTRRIVSVQGAGTYAAKLCADYRGGGKNDWFLPSKKELAALRAFLTKDRAAGLTGKFYWSSTEQDGSLSWLQGAGRDDQFADGKDSSACVRAVRAF